MLVGKISGARAVQAGTQQANVSLPTCIRPVVLAPVVQIQRREDIVGAQSVSRCQTVCQARTKSAPIEDDTDLTDASKQLKTPKDFKGSAPEILERGAPEHPYPSEFQQTLNASFTLGGVGLHTGEYALVRVRPAFAGEGRYFVRVPEGTNEHLADIATAVPVDLEEASQIDLTPELEERKLELYKQYLVYQDESGFDGTFDQFLHEIDAKELIRRREDGEDVSAEEHKLPDPEEIQARSGDDQVIPITLNNIQSPCALTVTLGNPDDWENTIIGVEHLLAALEAAGVDNARIEIEGGSEIPVLDGSAQGWAMQIQFQGVRVAPNADGSEEPIRRQARLYDQPITVHDADSFVSFVPENNMRITAGVDEHQASQIIGKQWKSWSIFEDLPFRFELGGARRYVPSLRHLQVAADAGFYKGGTEGTVLIGFGDRWYDPTLVRHTYDECARQQCTVLLGSLALLAKNGHAGLPFGHVMAYKATPELIIKFLREFESRTRDSDWVDVWDVPLTCDPMEFVDEGEDEGEEEEGEAGSGDMGYGFTDPDEGQDDEGVDGDEQEEGEDAVDVEADK